MLWGQLDERMNGADLYDGIDRAKKQWLFRRMNEADLKESSDMFAGQETWHLTFVLVRHHDNTAASASSH